eukprot:PLAT12464.8.p1 GENE.PLAT12464.8~~PLAT12464.8.p1  ORF type:complete len:415 (+),score=234.15 PLAT12464.8:568-1812(+)
MGFSYGVLTGKLAGEAINLLLPKVAKTPAELTALHLLLDSQWGIMKLQLPEEFVQELEGVQAGAASVGAQAGYLALTRALAVSNLATGNPVLDIKYVLKEELQYAGEVLEGRLSEMVGQLARACSMFGVWGSRSVDGQLWTGRNLDWLANTGMAAYKAITVFHPPNAHAHAALGFTGLYGALAGMSAKGITVHEAGLDNYAETLHGFPWVLRLRYIMERVETLEEMKTLWEATKNTVGINHGIGSAASGQFMALETKAGETAYFHADDPREKSYMHDGKQYGLAIPEALWRTNHGYAPTILDTAPNRTYPYGSYDSFNRYTLLHDAFVSYAAEGTQVDVLQAINLTAIAGDKGHSNIESFFNCSTAVNGENVLSVTFQPGELNMWVAFEHGLDADHVVACCNHYVKFDMKPWFA